MSATASGSAASAFGVLDDVGKTFPAPSRGAPEVVALERVTYSFRQGELVSLLGPSGCGKTTLLRIVAGMTTASSGRVEVRGREVTGPQDDFGFVFQAPNLLPWRTVLANVLFPMEIAGRNDAAAKKRALELLELVGLAAFAKSRPHQLSGGMKQRVALCRALVPGPSLLLMDEPFGALDELTRMEMQDLLLDIRRVSGTTVVFVTHSISEAIYLADEVLVFSKRPGRVIDRIRTGLAYPREARTSLHAGVYRAGASRRRGPRCRARASRVMSDSRIVRVLFPVAGLALLILLWHFYVVTFDVAPVVLPRPMLVLDATIANWRLIVSEGWITLLESLYGFILAFVLGVPLAVAIAGSRTLNLMFYPLLIATQSLPKVALAPLILVWLGTGIESKLAIAWLVAFFPIVVDTATGLRNTPAEFLDLATSVRANAFQTFWKIRFPAALPFVISGSKVAITLAVIGAVIGEFIGSNEGLGNLLLVANSQVNIPLAFACLIGLAAIGIGLYAAVAAVELALKPWFGTTAH